MTMTTSAAKSARRVLLNQKFRSNCIAFFILSVLAVCTVYYLNYFYQETYVWQVTELADVVRPSRRVGCEYISTNKNTTRIASFNGRKLKIGLLMVYGNAGGTWTKALTQRIFRNRELYCKKHGYELIDGHDLVDKSRPAAWSKLIVAKKYLKDDKFDYLMYIDLDVVIMNNKITVEDYILAAPPTADIIITRDWSGLNSGNWIIRNSEWSKWFLQEAWDQKQLVKERSLNGIKHPFEYEQRAFHYLLDTKIWRQRGLPTYPGNISSLWEHFHFLPQCAMNSYILHPLEFRADRDVSQFVDGDFLVHLAGKKGKVKTDVLQFYLNAADKNHKAEEIAHQA